MSNLTHFTPHSSHKGFGYISLKKKAADIFLMQDIKINIWPVIAKKSAIVNVGWLIYRSSYPKDRIGISAGDVIVWAPVFHLCINAIQILTWGMESDVEYSKSSF